MNFRAVVLSRRFCAIWLLFLIGALPAGAQNLPEKFQNLLQIQMNISEANLASLERGEAVTKLLKTRAKKEIAAFGILRVNAPGDLFIEKFRDIADFKKSATVLQIGEFSNPHFDGSLELGVFVEGSQGPATSESYMMYLNRSRADALQGWFLGIKRSLV